MTKRVTATIDKGHSYDECEEKLRDTVYLLHQLGDSIYASIDFGDKIDNKVTVMIEDDLLHLGLIPSDITVSQLI